MNLVKIILLVLVTQLILFGAKQQTQKHMPAIVPVSWLKQNLKNPHLVIIDVRNEKVFKKGHIKHAINLPTFKYLFDVKNNYSLPKLSFLKDTFQKAGIDDESLIVVYGNNEPIWAARFYWISKVLGHKEVGLLKVGYGPDIKKELPITTAIYKPKKTHFIPRVDSTILKTKLDVALSLKKDTIIDVRPPEFYMGLKSHAKRYGHIPYALNYPGSSNYTHIDGSSKIKTINKLKTIYKKLPKNKPVILYCEDGADAALNFLVLQQLGYKVSVYDGSWLEWGNDFHLPIESPFKKK